MAIRKHYQSWHRKGIFGVFVIYKAVLSWEYVVNCIPHKRNRTSVILVPVLCHNPPGLLCAFALVRTQGKQEHLPSESACSSATKQMFFTQRKCVYLQLSRIKSLAAQPWMSSWLLSSNYVSMSHFTLCIGWALYMCSHCLPCMFHAIHNCTYNINCTIFQI